MNFFNLFNNEIKKIPDSYIIRCNYPSDMTYYPAGKAYNH